MFPIQVGGMVLGIVSLGSTPYDHFTPERVPLTARQPAPRQSLSPRAISIDVRRPQDVKVDTHPGKRIFPPTILSIDVYKIKFC